MKTSHSVTKAITLALLLVMISGIANAATLESMEGIWLGVLKPAPEVELRLAVIVTASDGNTVSAVMKSLDQGGEDMPFAEVTLDGDTIAFKMNQPPIIIDGTVAKDGQSIDAKFRQGGGEFPLPMKRIDALPTVNRPQTPEGPFPYNEEDVTYQNDAAGITLAGTLTTPKSGGPFPAVILLTGSGAQDRNEEILGHKPFLVIADHLTRKGIAVLRVDDRGVGGSTGDFGAATTGDFADDALAGIKYLQTRKEIDPARIGLAGHSEGGIMAPIAAVKSSDVAFIVMLAGPGERFGDIINYQRTLGRRASGMSEGDLALYNSWYERVNAIVAEPISDDAAKAKIMGLLDTITEDETSRLNLTPENLEEQIPGMMRDWWRYAMAYDAPATLKQVTCPVLAIIGEKDRQVPSENNLHLIGDALKAGGNKHHLVKEMPGLNHLFQTADTGSESEYGKIEETFAPLALNEISEWLLEVVDN